MHHSRSFLRSFPLRLPLSLHVSRRAWCFFFFSRNHLFLFVLWRWWVSLGCIYSLYIFFSFFSPSEFPESLWLFYSYYVVSPDIIRFPLPLPPHPTICHILSQGQLGCLLVDTVICFEFALYHLRSFLSFSPSLSRPYYLPSSLRISLPFFISQSTGTPILRNTYIHCPSNIFLSRHSLTTTTFDFEASRSFSLSFCLFWVLILSFSTTNPHHVCLWSLRSYTCLLCRFVLAHGYSRNRMYTKQ